jgi:hypothetical protein
MKRFPLLTVQKLDSGATIYIEGNHLFVPSGHSNLGLLKERSVKHEVSIRWYRTTIQRSANGLNTSIRC